MKVTTPNIGINIDTLIIRKFKLKEKRNGNKT